MQQNQNYSGFKRFLREKRKKISEINDSLFLLSKNPIIIEMFFNRKYAVNRHASHGAFAKIRLPWVSIFIFLNRRVMVRCIVCNET